MSHRNVFLGCAAILGSLAGPSYAQITTLLQSARTTTTGDVVARFRDTYTDGRRYAFYKGEQYAIMTSNAGVLATRVLTGDPLPVALGGTLNDFEHLAINDAGDIVFTGVCNSTSVSKGYFISPAAGGALVHVNSGFPVIRNSPADINASRDVVWMNSDRQIYLYDDSAGTSTLIAQIGDASAPGGATWGRFGERPVISNNGVVAFIAEANAETGVFLYDPLLATFETAALTGDPAPQGAGATYAAIDRSALISIDDTGQVAFTATLSGGLVDAAAFLYTAGGGVSVVAEVGDAIVGAGFVVEELSDNFIGIDDLGRVAVLADIDPTNSTDHRILLQPLPGSGGPLSLHSPPVSDADDYSPRLTYTTAPAPGSTAFGDGSSVLRLAPGPSTATVIDAMTQTPIGPQVQSFDPSISHTGQIAFVSKHTELYVDNFSAPAALSLHEVGDPSPAGQGFTTIGLASLAADRRHAAFMVADDGPPPGILQLSHAIAYLRLNSPGQISPVAATGDAVQPPIGGTLNLGVTSQLAMRGRRIYFVSPINNGALPAALFLGRPGVPVRTILPVGAVTPVGTFDDIDDDFMDVTGNYIAFEGLLAGAPPAAGLFLMRSGRISTLRTVVKQGDPFAGGPGVFDSFGRISVNRKGHVLFGAESDLGVAGIFLYDGVGLTTVVLAGDPAPPPVTGGVFAFFPETSLKLSRKGEIFMALEIDGGMINDGLFLGMTAGPTAIALESSTPIPGGGTFLGFSTGQPLTLRRKAVIGTFDLGLTGYRHGILGIPY